MEWTANDDDAGLRLDKFLAAPERLGSRARRQPRSSGARSTSTRSRSASRMRRDGSRPETSFGCGSTGRAARRPSAQRPPGGLDSRLRRRRPAGRQQAGRNPFGAARAQVGAPSVYEQIEDRFRSHGKRRPFVVHRIDQDTSGLVVFAKHAEAQQRLKAQFARREPERVYLAVVYGHPDPPSGTWRDTLVWDTKALIQKETHPRDPRERKRSRSTGCSNRFATRR